jgi:hypothetical protein
MDYLALAKTSGFPLQIAAADVVSRGTNNHGWRVCSQEHPWTLGEDSGFADLVLEHADGEHVRMAIECKKRKGEFLFVASAEDTEATKRCRIRWAHRAQDCRHEGGWADVSIEPESPECQFCIVNGEGSEKQRTLLEATAHEVAAAADALCNEELALRESNQTGTALVYVPVLLTTANLVVCRMNPSDVELRTGELTTAQFSSVPMVRFRKSLRLGGEEASAAVTLGELKQDYERTVLVVNATALQSMLSSWKVDSAAMEPPWRTLRKQLDQEARERWMEARLRER